MILTRAGALRLGIVLLIALALPACGGRLHPSPAADRVELRIATSTRYYSVHGETTSAIFDYLEKHSPMDDKGRRAGGLTSSSWRLDGNLVDSPGGCGPHRITITLDLVMTLPQHDRLSSLSEEIKANWKRLVARITAHEQRHVDIYLDGAKMMKTRIEAIPSTRSCAELRKEIDRIRVSQKAATDEAQDQFHVEDDERVQNDRKPLRAQIDINRARLTTIESEIRNLDQTVAGLKRQLETAHGRIENSLVEAYNALVSKHNEAVSHRTKLAGEYDRVLAVTNRLLEAYNWTW